MSHITWRINFHVSHFNKSLFYQILVDLASMSRYKEFVFGAFGTQPKENINVIARN